MPRYTRERRAKALAARIADGPRFSLIAMNKNQMTDAELCAYMEQCARNWLDTWIKPELQQLIKEYPSNG